MHLRKRHLWLSTTTMACAARHATRLASSHRPLGVCLSLCVRCPQSPSPAPSTPLPPPPESSKRPHPPPFDLIYTRSHAASPIAGATPKASARRPISLAPIQASSPSSHAAPPAQHTPKSKPQHTNGENSPLRTHPRLIQKRNKKKSTHLRHRRALRVDGRVGRRRVAGGESLDLERVRYGVDLRVRMRQHVNAKRRKRGRERRGWRRWRGCRKMKGAGGVYEKRGEDRWPQPSHEHWTFIATRDELGGRRRGPATPTTCTICAGYHPSRSAPTPAQG